MEQFMQDHAIMIGMWIGLLIGLFGLVITVLERKLIVSRKHVTGVNGFTETMLGACITAGSIYAVSDRIIPAACELAGFIIAYALICRFVERKEYAPEDRYTKE